MQIIIIIIIIIITYDDETECSKTLTYKIQILGNYPEERIQQRHICQKCHHTRDDIGDVTEDSSGSQTVLGRRKRMVSAMLCTCA